MRKIKEINESFQEISNVIQKTPKHLTGESITKSAPLWSHHFKRSTKNYYFNLEGLIEKEVKETETLFSLISEITKYNLKHHLIYKTKNTLSQQYL